MYTQSGADAYRTTDTNSMTKEKIIVALYERVVSDLKEAEDAISANNRLKMTDRVNHSQRIVIELRNSLNHEIGGEISRNLESLYDYMFQEHLQLLASCDPIHISNCLRTLQPLLDAWRKIPVGTSERAARDHAQGKLIQANPSEPAKITVESEDKSAELISASA